MGGGDWNVDSANENPIQITTVIPKFGEGVGRIYFQGGNEAQ